MLTALLLLFGPVPCDAQANQKPADPPKTVRWQFWDAEGRTWFADVTEAPKLPPPPPQFFHLGLPGGPVQYPPPAPMPRFVGGT